MKDFLLDVAKYGRQIVAGDRFKACDRVKVHKTEFGALAHDNVLLGRIDTTEAILKAHKANPYPNVDELIGDLQIVLTESYNTLKKAPASKQMKVEDLL